MSTLIIWLSLAWLRGLIKWHCAILTIRSHCRSLPVSLPVVQQVAVRLLRLAFLRSEGNFAGILRWEITAPLSETRRDGGEGEPATFLLSRASEASY